MALFSRRRPPVVDTPATPEPAPEERSAKLLPGGLFAPAGTITAGSTAGEIVTIQSALRSSAAWACQRVLVSTISMLPVDTIQPTGTRRRPVPPPPVVRNPSGVVSRRGWVAQCVRSTLAAGNQYNTIVDVDDRTMLPTQVETVSPEEVTWMVVDGAETPFVNGKQRTLWPRGDFWHVPASQFLMPGSRVAMAPTEYASTALGTSLAAERFAANWMERGVHPSSLYYVDAPIDAAQAAVIKQTIMATQLTGEPGVLGSAIRRESVLPNLTDSRFIELLRFEVEQACRFWGVPPSMVYAAVSGQNITYANITQNDMNFLKYSVEAWIVDLEDAWSELAGGVVQVKFNVDAMLRMDALGRAQLAKVRLDSKTTTVNAVKALEDELPFDDPQYDMPGIPGATAQVTAPASDPAPMGGTPA